MVTWWSFSLVVMLFCMLFFPASTNAQIVDETDCTSTSNYSSAWFIKKIDEELYRLNNYQRIIFTDKDLATILRFHQQYCCEKRIAQDNCEDVGEWKKYYPESPYLFDHIINVGMRKFDAVQEHCDELGIDCTTQDNKTPLIERREKTREFAIDIDGFPPVLLYKLFQQEWWSPEDFTKDNNKIANKYFEMCREAASIRWATNNAWAPIDLKMTWGKWLQTVCNQLVQDRYLREARFVQTLMVEKGIAYMQKNFQSYLHDYFISNRMKALVDKFGKLDACFNMVLKTVERTECCVD